MAERVGFEPTVPLQARRISSAVHSTTLPPLRGLVDAVRRGLSHSESFAGWQAEIAKLFTLLP
jgi:hypothetical protein